MTTQFLQCLLPGFQLLRLEHEEIDAEGHHITVNGSSTQTLVQCPLCANPTTRIHSRYERTLADLPCVNYSLTLVMQVCKFFCDNANCIRRILVDLELNQPIALLADRKAETLTDWLIQHPGVEILSRDRSKTYKSAMDKGAPAAIQVADRFHLVKNLEETLAQVFGSYGEQLKAVEQQQGYTGCERTLTRYLSSVRAAQGLPPSRVKPPQGLPAAIDPQVSPLTKSRAAFLILKRVEHRDAKDTQLIAGIVSQHPALALAVELADEFLQLLRSQRPDAFDDWLLKAVKSSLKPLKIKVRI